MPLLKSFVLNTIYSVYAIFAAVVAVTISKYEASFLLLWMMLLALLIAPLLAGDEIVPGKPDNKKLEFKTVVGFFFFVIGLACICINAHYYNGFNMQVDFVGSMIKSTEMVAILSIVALAAIIVILMIIGLFYLVTRPFEKAKAA